MPWWGWLLVGGLLVLVVTLGVVLLTRKPPVPGLSSEEHKRVLDAEKQRLVKDLEAERTKSLKLQQLAEDLQKQLALISSAHESALEKIDDEKKILFEKLRKDSDALGRELDRLLGVGSDDSKQA
jgi:uncharacterized protein YlxW (UPF0749 family)